MISVSNAYFSDWRCPSGEWTWHTGRSSDTTAACGTAGTGGTTTQPLRRPWLLDTSRVTIRSSTTLSRYLLRSIMVTISMLSAPIRTGGCGVISNTGSVYFPFSHWLLLHYTNCLNVLFSGRGLCSARTPAPATRSQASKVTLTPGLIPSSPLSTSLGRPRPLPPGL